MRPILLLLAHPVFGRSRCNRRLVEAVADLDGVTVHDLYEAYPDLLVDVEREQSLLLEHHTVVFQHPFYWYSTPAMLKQWQDLVLEHGWAYGQTGTALHGKRLLCAVTAGGSADSYGADGTHGLTVRQLLAPIERTAALCGMDFLEPFVVHGATHLGDEELTRAGETYRRRLQALRDGGES